MEYIVRVLPEAEWPRLASTDMQMAQIQKAATTGGVIVVEDEDTIIACGAVMLCAHLEGVWVHPDYRRSVSVGRKLWTAIKKSLAAFGVTGFYGSTVSLDGLSDILSLKGTELEGRHFIMDVPHGR